MYHDILIPTDGSDASRIAIDHGIALAATHEATVHALSVTGEGPHGSIKQDRMRTDPEQEAAENVEFVEERAAVEGVEVIGAVRPGVPQDTILEYAAEAGVYAIVMGTAEKSGLDQLLSESVTEEVVRNASVPVVVLPGPER